MNPAVQSKEKQQKFLQDWINISSKIEGKWQNKRPILGVFAQIANTQRTATKISWGMDKYK